MKKRKSRNLQFIIGLILIGIIVTFLLIFSVFGNISVLINIDHRLESPSENFLLGTDDLGRDLISCIVYGTFISLFIAILVVLLSSFIGGLLGLISGFCGGIVDKIIMRIVDIVLAFPGILLAIGWVSFFKQGVFPIIFALTFSGWVSYARIVRGEVLKYKNSGFIVAAKSYNASYSRIIFKHLLPIIAHLMVVQMSIGISGVIIAESSLNFLGIGLNPEIPTLGQLIDSARSHMFDKPELILFPGLVLFFLILGFNFLGEGFRRIFTQRYK